MIVLQSIRNMILLTFISLLETNMDRYNIKEMNISIEYLQSQEKNIGTLMDDNSIFILYKLPKEVTKDSFKSFLTNLFKRSADSDTADFIRNYENEVCHRIKATIVVMEIVKIENI